MKLLIENVQFIFGALETPTKYSEESPEKYFGKFLVKQEETIKKIESAIKKIASEKFKPFPRELADFLFEPDLDKYPEQEDCVLFNAAQQKKPKLFKRSGEVIEKNNGKIYRGCYVNVLISLWTYNYKKAKRGVSANLDGVQYFAEGEHLESTANASDFNCYDDIDYEEAASPLG